MKGERTSQVVNHENDLVLSVVLEGHERSILVGSIGSEIDHLDEKILGSGEGNSLESGLVVDT